MARNGVEVKELLWDNYTVTFTLQTVLDHNEIKVKAGLQWVKGMVNGEEATAHYDESGKYLRIPLNAGIDVRVELILSDR